jgi:hypothetical protein
LLSQKKRRRREEKKKENEKEKRKVEGGMPAGCMHVECMALTLYAAKHA